MASHALDDRSREVLRTLIEDHITTGEPVGSESLSRRLSRSLSPATIRNIMADLERRGYLMHPHTSAGRAPTDEGYRVFVDTLMATSPLSGRETAVIRSGLRVREATLQQVMQNASHLLSQLSRHVGFVLAPDIGRTSFRRVDLVKLPYPRVLVVMVSQVGLVTNKVVEIEEDVTPEDLQACENYLNAHFAGIPLEAIRGRILELMRAEKALYDSLLKNVLSVAERVFQEDDQAADVYLDGTANMLDRPEFEDLGRMRELFKTFEEKGRLVKILNACISGHGVRVIIGHENPEPAMQDLTLVTAACPSEAEPAWALGVLGSTRMEYARVVTLVDRIAREVSETLSELSA